MTALAQRSDLRGFLNPPGQSTAWVADAECAQHSTPDLWFSDDYLDKREALLICRGCPVQGACLATALANEGGRSHSSRFGVIGGLLPSQRAQLARRGGV